MQNHSNPRCCLVLDLTPEEIDRHCRQVIHDNHRWISQWSAKTWTVPHVHGALLEQLSDEDRTKLKHQSCFKEKVKLVQSITLKDHQYCFSHGDYCKTTRGDDLEFSGLPCEENSQANHNRRFMEGRFGDPYCTWAKRHEILETPLIILENTPDAL